MRWISNYYLNNIWHYKNWKKIMRILLLYIYTIYALNCMYIMWVFIFIYLFTDASSSNEAVHLQQRLKSLSTELVTLRNRLHVGQPTTAGSEGGGNAGGVTGNTVFSGTNNSNVTSCTTPATPITIGSTNKTTNKVNV